MNGTLYSGNAVRTLATIFWGTATGNENTWSFDVNSHTAFGRYAFWGAARTDTIEWVFDAMGGAGVFQTFTFNPYKATRNATGAAEWWVAVNNGAFVKVWEAASAGTFSVGTIDLGVNGANLIQGGASKVTVRGIAKDDRAAGQLRRIRCRGAHGGARRRPRQRADELLLLIVGWARIRNTPAASPFPTDGVTTSAPRASRRRIDPVWPGLWSE